MRTTLSRLAMLFLLLALPTLALAEDLVPWASSLKEAQSRAGQQKRLVLIHFYGDACPPCKVVEKEIFSRPEFAQGLTSQYVPVKINAEKEPAIAKQFGVSRWPTDVIITAAGQQIHKMTSPQNYVAYATELNRVAVDSGLKPSTIAVAAKAARPVDHYAAHDPYSSAAKPAAPSASPANDRYNDRYADRPADRYADRFSENPPPRGRASYDEAPVDRRPVAEPPVAQPPRDRYAEEAPPASKRYDDYRADAPPRRSEPAREQRRFAPQDDRIAERPAPSADRIVERPAEQRETAPPVRQVSQVTPSAEQPSAGNPPLGLDGYCPVTFYEKFVVAKEKKAWKKGDPRFGAIHRGRLYLFAGEREQKEFLASAESPDKFSPALSGYDPVIFAREGRLVNGSRAFGTEFRKQVYLFTDEANMKEFTRDPRTYLGVVREAMFSTDSDSQRR